MAKKGQRILVKLRSTESGHMYITEKSRRNTQGRLELRKYDPTCASMCCIVKPSRFAPRIGV